MNKTNKSAFILKTVELALFTAIVLILQVTGTGIKLPSGTSISLVLLPIVLGSMLIGPSAGAFLGLLFGAIVYFAGVFGADGFTMILFNDHPILTAMVCFGKGIAAGLVPGLIYKFMRRKSPYLSVFLASASAPVVNTGLFILGALTMSDTLSANFLSEGMTVFYYLVIICAGINFIFEFLLNLILAPALHRILSIVNKSMTAERYY